MTDTLRSATRLIDEDSFTGKICIDGEWVVGAGGERASIEPATGATIATVASGRPAPAPAMAEPRPT